ncbi:PREDICTED: uncharacterized protein LOC107356013 isoform X2 [Acropora digitifera]|uniref:uncharacterized protein LOC107356013 isoform X2 n=1 Tax=Acropora digitifera TaxID=70779 RepID=UPI00077B2507|nr:PREDICTED: uncharacterized protein LOC107356013 isoform X2 [Acropora digitifera]
MDPFKKWFRQKRAKEKRKKLMEELKMPKETLLSFPGGYHEKVVFASSGEHYKKTRLKLQETLEKIEETLLSFPGGYHEKVVFASSGEHYKSL